MILGLCCVKNEELLIERVLSSYLAACDKILVLDDGSIDKTEEIVRSFQHVIYYKQLGAERNEGRDRSFLLQEACKYKPDWCWWFDGDETLIKFNKKHLNCVDKDIKFIESMLLCLWDNEFTYAFDWSHPKYHLFRFNLKECENYKYHGSGNANIHCGAFPKTRYYKNNGFALPICELHWGWLNKKQCDIKLAQYKEWDHNFDTYVPYHRFKSPPKDIRTVESFLRTLE